jgi:hypothetical protein
MTLGIAECVAVRDNTPLIPKPVDLQHPVGGSLETKSFHISPDSQVLASVQSGRHGSKYEYVRLVEKDDSVLLNGYETTCDGILKAKNCIWALKPCTSSPHPARA